MKWLEGKKTYVAAALAALLAANELLRFIPADTVQVILYVAASLGLVGVRSAIERVSQKAAE